MVSNGSFAIFLLPGKPAGALKFGIEVGTIHLDTVTCSFVVDALLLAVLVLLTFRHARAGLAIGGTRIGTGEQTA